ncbi:hypothetical protein HanRHA438_Chr04g0194791 [Helianthus annuus]|uniref:Uncharacterized protein n=1 Tax=Helianthus annuus TaxID=4232 RepID=A0A9K3JBE3_HELAN|nr:hypothetical protein HanXRQr2_Chr04g0185121 [Helianthus annuus]KAJ0928501.1 hypothetical protein HanRHA438_Chr04g0194791 [Helianthus annuus]
MFNDNFFPFHDYRLKRERHSGLVKYTYLCQKSGFFAFDHEDSSVLDVQQAPISCFNGFLLMFSELRYLLQMNVWFSVFIT